MQDHLSKLSPGFGIGRKYSGVPRRFKKVINAIDSTTIKLFANCMNWAKHRRRKAAAKMHLSLNLQSFLPRFIVVEPAKGHDATKAWSYIDMWELLKSYGTASGTIRIGAQPDQVWLPGSVPQ